MNIHVSTFTVIAFLVWAVAMTVAALIQSAINRNNLDMHKTQARINVTSLGIIKRIHDDIDKLKETK